MKQQFENALNEKDKELARGLKDIQRLERLNQQLLSKNNSLTETVAQLRDQVLSTIAGSGSNQRDT